MTDNQSLILVKLGGSLITDKRVESSFREMVMQRIAQEIAQALAQLPDTAVIIGHGSGSFGHFAAKRYGTMDGVRTPEQWRGFAEVATVAAELNYLVARVLQAEGIPVWRVQPSASVLCNDAVIQEMALTPLRTALSHGVVPLVYGDVAVDTVRGGTIVSTETVFTYLVEQLPVTRVLLLGEVAGVYDAEQNVIPEITPANYASVQAFLGDSGGTDVTGGMLTKVQDMLALVQAKPDLKVHLFDGMQPGNLMRAMLGESGFGTLIYAG